MVYQNLMSRGRQPQDEDVNFDVSIVSSNPPLTALHNAKKRMEHFPINWYVQWAGKSGSLVLLS